MTIGELFEMSGTTLEEFNGLIEKLGTSCDGFDSAVAYMALRSVSGFMYRDMLERPKGDHVAKAMCAIADKFDSKETRVA